MPARELPRAVRRLVGCHVIGDHLSSGAHATDAVGTETSIADALRITRPRGRVVLMGMPAEVTLDLTGLWHRETELVGAYTYGTEALPDGRRATFDLAIETADAIEAERWLSGHLPARRPRRRHRPRRRRRPRGRSRSPSTLGTREMRQPCRDARPGFVLDVDRSTPPTLFWRARASASSSSPPTAAG